MAGNHEPRRRLGRLAVGSRLHLAAGVRDAARWRAAERVPMRSGSARLGFCTPATAAPAAAALGVPATLADADDDRMLFPRTWRRRIAWIGAAVAVLVTALGPLAGGPGRYPIAWDLASALFVGPTALLVVLARARTTGTDRIFWSWWLAGMVVAAAFGVGLLVQQLAGVSLVDVGGATLGLAGVLWLGGIWHLVRSSGGSRIVAIDALEVLVAALAVVAPVLVAIWPDLAAARAMWWAVPAAGASAVMPVVAALSIMLCSHLPASQRRPELIGVVAAIAGEVTAILQLAQGVTDFRLPAAPLLGSQVVALWLLLMLVVNGHRSYPAGLDRFSPDAQVRRRSLLPLFVIAAVPALAAEAVTASSQRYWTVPVAVGALGAAVVVMTFRHVLVVNETRQLYGQLAVEADRRHAMLDGLVRAVDEDRHRVLAQLHELATEWMAAIGALLRTSRSSAGTDPEVMANVLGRIYADVGARAELLRRLMQAVQPPVLSAGGLESSIIAAAASTFGRSGSPDVTVTIADGIELDWMTSTLVYRIVLEAQRSALSRMPVTELTVRVDPASDLGGLVVTIEDDARGADLLASADRSGLSALRLFADLAGGTVSVDRRPSGGTRVVVVLGNRR
jgi:signal transduction histidine kinase